MKKKIKNLIVLNICITLLILTSCSQPQFNDGLIKKPQDIVDYCVENAIVFDFDNTSNSIPDELVDTLSDYKVVLSRNALCSRTSRNDGELTRALTRPWIQILFARDQ
ncbi:hypothetical protein [Tissierella sp.]|uniref:hypothetical protein n=1 Tax=Tissierella sp. TaxID=41274 RepID=UPI00285E8CD0|nr:hypothetical protein [Tissierella sp.]MDR7856737.1 hypothetical protein [Tissierella sp.]